jgi:hypothetical protein
MSALMLLPASTSIKPTFKNTGVSCHWIPPGTLIGPVMLLV